MAARGSPFGRVTLVSGPEALLADRAVETVLQQIREEAPESEVTESEAVRLDRGKLAEITSASLFSTRRAAVITDLGELPAELQPTSVASWPTEPRQIWPWFWSTGGGSRQGAAGPGASRRAETIECDCPPQAVGAAAVRPAEAKRRARRSSRRGPVPGRGRRSRSAGPGRRCGSAAGRRRAQPLTVAEVRRYFGGRAGGDQLRGRRRGPRRADRSGAGAAAVGDVDRRGPGPGDQRAGDRGARTGSADHRAGRAAGRRSGS